MTTLCVNLRGDEHEGENDRRGAKAPPPGRLQGETARPCGLLAGGYIRPPQQGGRGIFYIVQSSVKFSNGNYDKPPSVSRLTAPMTRVLTGKG